VKAASSVPVLLDLVERTKDESLRKPRSRHSRPMGTRKSRARAADFPKLGKPSQSAALSLLASRAGSARAAGRAVESAASRTRRLPLEIVVRSSFSLPTISPRARKRSGVPPALDDRGNDAKDPALRHDAARGAAPALPTQLFRFHGTCGACTCCITWAARSAGPHEIPKRDDLDALLLNIINPSAEIREATRTSLSPPKMAGDHGFLAEQDPQVVVLRGLDGQNVSLPRGQIADMKNAGVSLMPEGC